MGYYNRQNRVLDDLLSKNVKSPYALQQLGMAKQLFNGRMAGAPQLQNNIFSSQANTIDAANRNATDSSQALAFAAGAQGQTDQSLSDLQTKEMQNREMMLQNLNQAYVANIDEDRNNFQNLVSLKGAKAQNELAKRKALWNTVGQVANLGVSAFTGGMFGGIKGGGRGNSQFGGSGMGAAPYGASVYGQLSAPRTRLTLNG